MERNSAVEQRFNNQSFHTLAFIMEHDFAGCEMVGPRMAAPFQANLDRIDFEQRVPLMSRLYEEHFVRNAVEYLGVAGGGAAALELGRAALYPEVLNCGFAVRRFGDELIVTCVWADERLRAGDRIVMVNGYDVPAFAKQAKPVLSDQSGDASHEVWDIVLAFSRHFDVRRGNGQTERLKTRHVRDEAPCKAPLPEDAGDGLWVVRLGRETDGRLAACLRDGFAGAEPRGMVIDVRESAEMDEEDALALLPLVIDEAAVLEELPGFGPFHLWCSPNNCRLTADILVASAEAMESQGLFADAAATRSQAEEIRSMSGRGFQQVDLAGNEITPVEPLWPGVPVVVLADIATAGEAEKLVRLAKDAARGTVLGRATRGTLDWRLPLTVSLDAAYSVRYPAALSPEAWEGNVVGGRGVTPDVAVTWGPAHLGRDVDLERALALLRS